MGPISKASGDGWDQQDLGQASGRDHQGSGRVGGSTKALRLRAGSTKASTTHSGMPAATFLSDEEAWSMELGCASVTDFWKAGTFSVLVRSCFIY